jgi:hypothetical protein
MSGDDASGLETHKLLSNTSGDAEEGVEGLLYPDPWAASKSFAHDTTTVQPTGSRNQVWVQRFVAVLVLVNAMTGKHQWTRIMW